MGIRVSLFINPSVFRVSVHVSFRFLPSKQSYLRQFQELSYLDRELCIPLEHQEMPIAGGGLNEHIFSKAYDYMMDGEVTRLLNPSRWS